MNSDERLLADFLQPLLTTDITPPQLEDFSQFQFSEEILEWNPEWDELEGLVTAISAHQTSAAAVRVGATVPKPQD